MSEMLTGVHSAWREARAAAAGSDALRGAALGVPCRTAQQRRLRVHDYCLPAVRFEHAPAHETTWHRGVVVIGNERHITNFHHFNRDVLFFARVLSRGLVPMANDNLLHVVIVDRSDMVDWSIEHVRAILGPAMLRRLVVLGRQRARLSNTSMLSSLPPPSPLQQATSTSATAARTPLATVGKRYACYDAAIEKLVTWPADRDDLAWVRNRALAYCRVREDEAKVEAPPMTTTAAAGRGGRRAMNRISSGDAAANTPNLLVLILRGDASLGDGSNTARQTENPIEVRSALDAYAKRVGLTLRVTSFGGMSYCEQVRLAARARILVGVHGQGITNGQFMPDDGLVVELFHGGRRPYWTEFDGVGHQPLFLGGGRPYVAAPLAESSCAMMQWKHTPSCKSYVNATRLVGLLAAAHEQMLIR